MSLLLCLHALPHPKWAASDHESAPLQGTLWAPSPFLPVRAHRTVQPRVNLLPCACHVLPLFWLWLLLGMWIHCHRQYALSLTAMMPNLLEPSLLGKSILQSTILDGHCLRPDFEMSAIRGNTTRQIHINNGMCWTISNVTRREDLKLLKSDLNC